MKGSRGLRQLLVWMSEEKYIKTKDCRGTSGLKSQRETHPVVKYDKIVRFTAGELWMQAVIYGQM